MQQDYLYETKSKVIPAYFVRIEFVVKLLLEVKSAVEFLSHTFMITVLAHGHQSRKISDARMTSLHDLCLFLSFARTYSLPMWVVRSWL